jgi:hypothetical protein
VASNAIDPKVASSNLRSSLRSSSQTLNSNKISVNKSTNNSIHQNYKAKAFNFLMFGHLGQKVEINNNKEEPIENLSADEILQRALELSVKEASLLSTQEDKDIQEAISRSLQEFGMHFSI